MVVVFFFRLFRGTWRTACGSCAKIVKQGMRASGSAGRSFLSFVARLRLCGPLFDKSWGKCLSFGPLQFPVCCPRRRLDKDPLGIHRPWGWLGCRAAQRFCRLRTPQLPALSSADFFFLRHVRPHVANFLSSLSCVHVCVVY